MKAITSEQRIKQLEDALIAIKEITKGAEAYTSSARAHYTAHKVLGDLEPREASAVDSVIKERQRQDGKWGQQNHEPMLWMGILGEEFGELCQAVNESTFNNGPEAKKKGGYDNMRAEAVQVAAVAVAFVEMLDRRKGDVNA